MGEIHIIILWNSVISQKEKLEHEIRNTINILRTIKYTWNPILAAKNYAAFYGERLDDIDYKVAHCGTGSFIVYIVYDKNPKYAMRSTTSGKRFVNSKMFDLKTKLRNISGGGHKVHASDSEEEAKVNIASLFECNQEELLEKYTENIIEVKRNIAGVGGWQSIFQILKTLSYCTDYVVLRGFEEENDKVLHGDTDLLVRNWHAAKIILAGQKVRYGKESVLIRTTINNVEHDFDIRHIGDQYYCEQWEKDILDNHIWSDTYNFFIPNDIDYRYSLLYHALVQKQFISSDYKSILEREFKTSNRYNLSNILIEFMNKRHYSFTCPKDKSVFIFPYYFNKMDIPISRKTFYLVYYYIRKMRKRENGKEEHDRSNEEIYTILSSKYHLARKFLRKIKAYIVS